MFDPQADVLKQIMGMADEASMKRAMARKQSKMPQPAPAPQQAAPAVPAPQVAGEELAEGDARALMDLYAQDTGGAPEGDDKIEPGVPSEELTGTVY